MKRVNIGCGLTPTAGWYSYDNSLSVRLAMHSTLTFILDKIGFLNDNQKKFILFARNNNIKWADATKRIPLPDNSAKVLYSSHMVEHLDPEEVKFFLQEARRVLIKSGIIRIVIPDLRKLAEQYISDGDANAFLKRTGLTRRRRKGILNKLKYLLIGDRHHQWMYDGCSMVRLLASMGFEKPHVLPPGSTNIPDPDELNLYEREDQSVYIEAFNA